MSAFAELTSRALLVGINDYPGNESDLEGAVNDVDALEQVLKKSGRFTEITVLRNQEATLTAITDKIDELSVMSVSGDRLLIFFAGHGVSPRAKPKKGSQEMPWKNALPLNSSAFVPYDNDLARLPVNERAKRLLISRRDLKPRLQKLDRNGVETWLVADACYSGELYRSALGFSLKNRQYDPENANFPVVDEVEVDPASATYDQLFPNRNIYFLGASGSGEPASEIMQKNIDSGDKKLQTLDNKPHGLFTDRLLRVLTGKLDTDMNRDGLVSNSEVGVAIASSFRRHGFTEQTPVLFPPNNEVFASVVNRGFLGFTETMKKVEAPVNLKFAVVLNARPALKEQLAAKGVTVLDNASAGGDYRLLHLARKDGVERLIEGSGLTVTEIASNATDDDVLKAIMVQVGLDELAYKDRPDPFKVYSQIAEAGVGSILREGQMVSATFGANLGKGYLLTFSVDSEGITDLLLPNRLKQPLSQAPEESNFPVFIDPYAQVYPPFGRVSSVSYFLDRWEPALNDEFLTKVRWNGTAFEVVFNRLEQLLNDMGIKYSVNVLDVYTEAAPVK